MTDKREEVNLLSEFNANIWAKEFMHIWGNRLNEVDESLMTSWFANAIMMGYDTGLRKADADEVSAGTALINKIKKLESLILLADPVVSMEEMNSISSKQWNEYIRYEEAGEHLK
jgi:hypothetical protein